MPHLIDAVASGATSSTILRNASRMGRKCDGCLAKKPSIGAPKSARRLAIGRALGFFAPVPRLAPIVLRAPRLADFWASLVGFLLLRGFFGEAAFFVGSD